MTPDTLATFRAHCEALAPAGCKQSMRGLEVLAELDKLRESVSLLQGAVIERVNGFAEKLAAENTRLRAALEPFAEMYRYADEELTHLPLAERDALQLNHYDPRSAKVSHARHAAIVLAGKDETP
jgi:hypothetical protein